MHEDASHSEAFLNRATLFAHDFAGKPDKKLLLEQHPSLPYAKCSWGCPSSSLAGSLDLAHTEHHEKDVITNMDDHRYEQHSCSTLSHVLSQVAMSVFYSHIALAYAVGS